MTAVCRCTHTAAYHQHHRRGTDCSLCPCTWFRRRIAWTGRARYAATVTWVLTGFAAVCVLATMLGATR